MNFSKYSHFTCFTDSPLLLMIMRKGCNKICCKTSTLIEAISIALIHLYALPSFELSGMPSSQDAWTISIPPPVYCWLHHMHISPSDAVILALTNDNTISPL